MAQKRPVYVVQVRTGVMVPTDDRTELEEAVIILDIKQTRESADRAASGHEDAEVVKRFLT